jgi:hypothetical protein
MCRSGQLRSGGNLEAPAAFMGYQDTQGVSKDNLAEIVACGRARCKIESYELEHNFGRGQRLLAMTLAALDLLAFAWHTVLELLEPPW